MTLIAIHVCMKPTQWKSALIVNLSNVLYYPTGRCVATITILPYGLLMHIFVTSIAVGFGFRKFERTMTTSTIHRFVLGKQRKSRFVMIKFTCFYFSPIFG